MADCNIGRIQSGAFSGLEEVNYISIHNCNIITIDPMAFAGVAEVQLLELTASNISDLELGAFSGLEGKVAKLNISQNNIDCDCRYKALLDLAEDAPNVTVNNTCVESWPEDRNEEFLITVFEDCGPKALVAGDSTALPSKANQLPGPFAHFILLIICWFSCTMKCIHH